MAMAVVPLFCPEPGCGRPMNREEDTKAFNRRGKCFFCLIHEDVEKQGEVLS
jgi:hypothetical protein